MATEGTVSTPVEIVRPERKTSEWVRMLVIGWAGIFVTAATTMLLIGACHHEIDRRIPAFGYLQTLLGLYTLKTVVGAVSGWDAYKLWTREAKPRR